MSASTSALPGGLPRPEAASQAAEAGPLAVRRRPDPSRGPLADVLRRFRWEFFWVCVFSLFVNLLMLSPTLYMLQIFDRVMVSGNGTTLLALTGLMILLSVSMAFAEWVRSRLLVRVGGRLDEVLSRPVFGAAFTAQLSRAQRSPQQPLADLNTLRQFLTGNGVLALVDTPWTIVFVGALFMMHPLLGWLSLGFCVVQLALGFVVQRLQSKNQKIARDLAMDSTQYLQAKLRNAETVESMGMQGNLQRQWMALHTRQMVNHAKTQEMARRVAALMKWVQYTQQALMLALGAVLAINGKVSSGVIVASNTLMGNALRPIGLIVQIWGQTAEAKAAYVRLNQLLAAQPADAQEAPAAEVKGQITLKGLKAGAPNRPTPILKGLDAEFRAGEVIGIVGPSGAGKSTLARCLLGIWPGAEGEVLIDGHAVTDWPRQVLGPHIGYLPQDVELFEGSVAENIARFGDADPMAVIQAAKLAGIHDMVLRMPKGYDTVIGDNATVLSGGQRQRLGLARALLGDPAIVVLDEPSANLDDAGEAALVNAVRAIKARGATVFMIVHQQHMLSLADRVLVLEAGQISKLVPVVVAPAVAAQKA
jgi:ATP-binding cassette, subfamily C, bacterial exporter for protease/lipase